MMGLHDFNGDMWWWGPGHGWLGILLAMFFGVLQLVFWIVVIVIVVRLIRGMTTGERSTPTRGALHVLEERYARGEIDQQEFIERRSVLLGREPPPSESPTQQL